MNHPIQEIYFYGYCYEIAQKLLHIGNLKEIFCEKRTFNKDIYNFAELNSIKFTLIKNKKDLNESLPKNKNNSVAFSCSFMHIFKQKHIDSFSYGIWNIHGGELPKNRGRHAFAWAFLNNYKRFGISIHEINEEIDLGKLLAEGFFERNINDTMSSVQAKAMDVIVNGLIEKAIENYFAQNTIELSGGNYYESLENNKFKDIASKDYDNIFIYNLIKSQKEYGGVKINGKQYTEVTFINEDMKELYADFNVIECKNNTIIGLQ